MKKYTGENLEMVAFPLGGIGAGMVCIEGNGSFGSFSIRNTPDVNQEPFMFSALTIIGKENMAKILEGPVAKYKIFAKHRDSGNGLAGKAYGLPRFTEAEFSSRFPFGYIRLTDDIMPVTVDIKAWSPFIPNDADNSSLPFAGIEYTITNTSNEKFDAVYYFNSTNFMKADNNSRIRPVKNGFVLEQDASEDAPHNKGAFCASVSEDAYVDKAWLRAFLMFDILAVLWNNIKNGRYGNKSHIDPERGESPGATLAVPFSLSPGEAKTIRLMFSWFVPDSDIRVCDSDNEPAKVCEGEGCCCDKKPASLPKHKPWYTTVINDIDHANKMWNDKYESLLIETAKFTDAFYDITLPEAIIDAVSANLSILKSPTVLRQTDGRLWGWEGCCDCNGCCHGSCTHVWNYAQAVPNLFPQLERGFRFTEFNEMQCDETGHQTFRSNIPITKIKNHKGHAASDGQLGGIIKVYREWRISGDTGWLKSLWSKVKQSLNYCINQWDRNREGVLVEPHHNTYDIEFWGPDGMCSSFYLGALKAAYEMGKALGEECTEYLELYKKGRKYLEEKLFNGEYFYQKVMYEGLSTSMNYGNTPSEFREITDKEGPIYQYGNGCISDGVLGVWLAELSGLSDILDEEKVVKNLQSIYKYNFKKDLSNHANPQRPGYALGKEAGLLLCSWPYGGKPSLPFIYSDEVWTGIEYQVASHLLMKGFTKEGLDIVEACRNRYDGKVRNPYNEYECGHWYARAMSSYALLQGYTGVRYDALTKTLYAKTNNSSSYKTFLSTATGYGNVEMNNGKVTVTVVSGKIDIEKIVID